MSGTAIALPAGAICRTDIAAKSSRTFGRKRLTCRYFSPKFASIATARYAARVAVVSNYEAASAAG
jgi:hypothetical protein